MSKLNKKINIWAIVAAISFLYLAFIPYITNPIYNLLLGYDFVSIIKLLLSTIFNFGNAVYFVGYILIAVGILTKFDKISLAAGSALFWLSSIVSLILNIINSIKHGYSLGFGYFASTFFHLLAYFLLFAVALWVAILFFAKKPTPKIAKIVIFVPLAILAVLLIFAFFSNTSNVISALTSGQAFQWTLYSIVINSMNTFNTLISFVGFTAAAFKIAEIGIKKSPENTVEISEGVIIENVTTE